MPSNNLKECLSKKYQYESYAASKRAAKRKNATKWATKTGKKLRSYKCSFCEGWHHTTKALEVTNE
jgi:hypothetical protein